MMQSHGIKWGMEKPSGGALLFEESKREKKYTDIIFCILWFFVPLNIIPQTYIISFDLATFKGQWHLSSISGNKVVYETDLYGLVPFPLGS